MKTIRTGLALSAISALACLAAPNDTGAAPSPNATETEAAKAEAAAKVAKEKADKEAAKAEAKRVKDEKTAADKAAKEAAKKEAADKKAKELADKKAAKEKADADAKAAREANRMPEQNGIRRPKPDGLCGKAWAIFDTVSAKNGSPASIGESMDEAKKANLNEANVRAEYARWRKFHGVSGRIAPPKADPATGTTDAGAAAPAPAAEPQG